MATVKASNPDLDAGVAVELQDESRTATAPPISVVRDCLSAAVRSAGIRPVPVREITVRFVDEDEGRSLNMQFRHQDKATNVLSFQAEYPAGLPASEYSALGDIVICGPVVEREAAEQGKCVADHWCHMLVHGTLHLAGFDHQDDEAAREMERIESEALAACGIDNPYQI